MGRKDILCCMNRTCRRHMKYYARNKGVCEFLRNVDAPRRPLGSCFCLNRQRGFANSFDFSISLLPWQSAQCLLTSKHYIADWNVEGFAECGDGIQAGFFQATLKIGDEDGTYSCCPSKLFLSNGFLQAICTQCRTKGRLTT